MVTVQSEEVDLPGSRNVLVAAAVLFLLLQACANTPPAGKQPADDGGPPPELKLNLPEQPDSSCARCVEQTGEHNLLEKGFRALIAGDHREAVNYFRRYQRLDTSPAVDWEAEIAVTYDKMFPKSPYYNSKAASETYQHLKRQQPEGVEVHEIILMMRDALEILVSLHQKIDDQQDEKDVLEEKIDILSENLEKREEALKRLRELTLGQ
jgi:hypothetical protein